MLPGAQPHRSTSGVIHNAAEIHAMAEF
jgi:hypothetical protein